MTVAFNYLGKLGQLGNQMFQFAATLGVARYTGVTYSIPNHDEVLVDGFGNRLRIELFDCFDIKPENTGILKTEYVVQRKDLNLMPLFLVAVDKLTILCMDIFRQKNISNTVQEN